MISGANRKGVSRPVGGFLRGLSVLFKVRGEQLRALEGDSVVCGDVLLARYNFSDR